MHTVFKTIGLFSLTILFSFSLFAQSKFEHLYEPPMNVYRGNEVAEKDDGNLCFMAGMTDASSPVRSYLHFTDMHGNLQDVKRYEVLLFDGGSFVQASALGYTLSSAKDNGLIWAGTAGSIIRVDQNGYPNWGYRHEYGEQAIITFEELIQKNEDNYLAMGSIYHFEGKNYPYVQRIDDNGSLIWNRELRLHGYNWGHSLFNLPDDRTLAIFGKQHSTSSIILWGLASDGSTDYIQEIDLSPIAHELTRFQVMRAQNGDLVFAICFIDKGTNAYKNAAFRLSTSGQILWVQDFTTANGVMFPVAIQETAQGDFIIAGDAQAFQNFGFLTKINGGGNLQNTIQYPFNLVHGISTFDQGYLYLGLIDDGSGNNVYAKSLLMKTPTDMRTDCNDDPLPMYNLGSSSISLTDRDYESAELEIEAKPYLIYTPEIEVEEDELCYQAGPAPRKGQVSLETALLLYPNPSAGRATIEFASLAGMEKTLSIFDLQGRLVEQHQLSEGVAQFKLSLTEAGMYLVRVEAEGQRWQEKLMVR